MPSSATSRPGNWLAAQNLVAQTRTRTSLSGVSDATLVPHFRHYYPEGNIIIVAEKTKFRVFKSMLAQQSQVFRDMFGTVDAKGVEAASSQALIDGLPAIWWSDTAEDVTNLLDTILPPTLSTTPPSMRAIYSIIHLSDKYQFEQTHKQAVQYLIEKYPKTLQDFQNDSRLRVYDDFKTAVYVIKCSRSIGDVSVIPLALYALAVNDWGTMKSGEYRVVVEALSPEDHARIHIGKANIMALVANAIDAAASAPVTSRVYTSPFANVRPRRSTSWHCDDQNRSTKKPNTRDPQEPCQASRIGFLFPMRLKTLMANPLYGAQERLKQSTDEMCKECNEASRKLCASLVADIISQLPTLFKL